jgi:hypothetical protein
MSEPLAFEFGPGISPEHAEQFVSDLGKVRNVSQRVTVVFNDYSYFNPGVGWRLGNAMRRFSGSLLEVVVPPFLDGHGDWFRVFTRSCLGDAIAKHAGRVMSSGVDITGIIRDYYAKHSVRESQNSVVIGSLHEGVNIDPDREDLFRKQFLKSLRYVNVKPSCFNQDRLHDLLKLVFEAVQNVYDHSKRKPLPEHTPLLSYMQLSYYKSISKNHSDSTGKIKSYVERLNCSSPNLGGGFVQICINDDGVGIAGRQAQDLDIYWGSVATETTAIYEALTSRSSVKLRAQDSRVRGTPGQGYTYIDTAIRSLRAFSTLRTGRTMAILDGTDNNAAGFELLAGEFGYMPGTSLDVLIPIPGDPQLMLFPDN